MKHIILLDDPEALDWTAVGHKYSSLARAHRAGFPVPPAAVIRTEANRFFLEHKTWPESLLEEASSVADALGLEEGISVRSSSTWEDLETHSFAGQYKTFLNVRTRADLIDKIERCWESAAGIAPNYLQQLTENIGPDLEGLLVGVILQKMVQASLAGVAFSRNPLYPSRDEVVIEYTEGLGEELVSGRITPHRVFIAGDGSMRFEGGDVRREGGTALSTRQHMRKVAMLAREVDAHAGSRPQDIEWAVDGDGTLWLLQSRAITTIKEIEGDAPAGVWTRRIANDLWADRLTRFMADALLRNAPRFDLSTIVSSLGIPLVKPVFAVINGYLYVNCEGLKQVLRFVPARFRTRELRSLFPPGFDIHSVPSPSLLEAASLAIRACAISTLDPAANPFFCRKVTLRKLAGLEKRIKRIQCMPEDAPEQALEKLRSAVACMADLQQTNQWPYAYATIFTWALQWLVIDVMGLKNDDFLRLMSGNAKNISVEIETELRRIADAIEEDEAARTVLMECSPGEAMGSLPEAVRTEIVGFLARYGVRSRHRTLLMKRWAEVPEDVLGMLVALVNVPTGDRTKESAHGSSDAPIPLQEFNLIERLGLRLVQYNTRTFLDLREELRFFLDKILYVIRRALLRLGETTGLGESAMFLTEAELDRVVSQNMNREHAAALARRRLEEFSAEADPYAFYIDGRPVNELSSSSSAVLKGIGTSPGRATGHARIVADPARASIQKGDILVARNTDPGWTPILSMVGGVVVEEGGLLNHCSIVARELGIPAVVGVRQATRMIPEGNVITVDGNLGTVQLGA